jgi:hypothetical protein
MNDTFIMALAVRGIGIISACDLAGVDLVLPVLHEGQHLKRTNITVVMMQSKNDAKFPTTPKRYLFSAMNPFTLGIFSKGEQNPRLVIRIVYALAARESIVYVMERGRPSVPRESKNKDLLIIQPSTSNAMVAWLQSRVANTTQVLIWHSDP